jgi:hypothetical protein
MERVKVEDTKRRQDAERSRERRGANIVPLTYIEQQEAIKKKNQTTPAQAAQEVAQTVGALSGAVNTIVKTGLGADTAVKTHADELAIAHATTERAQAESKRGVRVADLPTSGEQVVAVQKKVVEHFSQPTATPAPPTPTATPYPPIKEAGILPAILDPRDPNRKGFWEAGKDVAGGIKWVFWDGPKSGGKWIGGKLRGSRPPATPLPITSPPGLPPTPQPGYNFTYRTGDTIRSGNVTVAGPSLGPAPPPHVFPRLPPRDAFDLEGSQPGTSMIPRNGTGNTTVSDIH